VFSSAKAPQSVTIVSFQFPIATVQVGWETESTTQISELS